MQKYYRILGVPYDASLEELKKAYKNLVKVWHPDRFAKDDQLRKLAQEKIVEINEAFAMLRSITPGTYSDAPPKPSAQPESKTEPQPQQKKTETTTTKSPAGAGGTQQRRASSAPVRNWQWYYSVMIASILIGSVIAGAALNQEPEDDTQERLPFPAQSAGQQMIETLSAEIYFTAGSTKEEVLAIQGSPSEVTDGTWRYGNSRVYFENDRVANWYTSPSDPLRVRMIPVGMEIESKGYFSIGSTKEEVMSIQGSPTDFNESTWRYGNSMVQFEFNRVAKWYESPANPLRVRSLIVEPLKTKEYYTLGSLKDDILMAQGMPTEFSENVWRYGFSMLYFENGRLSKWYESRSTPLKIKAPTAKATTPKEYFTIGSTKDDVLNVQGTPTQFTEDVWRYGSSMVYFSGGRVANYYISPADPIKLKLDAEPVTTAGRKYFTIGSTKDEVLAIQGVPTHFTDAVWSYGSSRINFEKDRVVSWVEHPANPLNIAPQSHATLTQ